MKSARAYTDRPMVRNTATAAGEHPVTVSLTDKTHYTWADGSTDDLTLTFTIGKATYDMSGVSFTDVSYTYDGSAQIGGGYAYFVDELYPPVDMAALLPKRYDVSLALC